MISLSKTNYRVLQWLLFIAMLGFVIGIYNHWYSIIAQVVEWQKIFHELLAKHVNAIAEDPVHHGLMLIGLSFFYGVFHAVGPGHGKAVIVTYLASHNESLRRGAVISLLAALLQAVIAVLLVIIVSQLLSIQFFEVNNYADDITQVSYLLVMLLGAFLFFTALYKQWKQTKQDVHEHNEHNEHNEHQHEHEHDHGHEHHAHTHDHSCCGGHHVHQAEPQESWLQSLGVIVSMGMRPCTGAILVLIYAHLVGAFYYGVIATLVMGFGTGLAIASMALATQLARNWFEKLVQSHDGQALFRLNVGPWLRVVGGLVIFLLGLSLFQAGIEINNVNHPLL